MNRRAAVKRQHEQAVVDDFVSWLNRRYRARYEVIDRPDPPEAVIRTGTRTRWVEVADVYHSEDWARDVVSYATPGEEHHDTSGIWKENVDDRLATRFVDVLKSKLTKRTYAPFRDKYGRGFLVLYVNHPWLDHRTFDLMRQACERESWRSDLGYFSSVFLTYRFTQEMEYRRWRYA